MPYTIKETRTYAFPSETVYTAALGAIAGLGGKIASQDDENLDVVVKFDKKILGKTLGDRTHLQAQVTDSGDSSSAISIEAYPLDPVGQKLMFGARKGVTSTVVNWFFAHLEHRLPK